MNTANEGHELSSTVIKAFQPILEHCSLYGAVIIGEIQRELESLQRLECTAAQCEMFIGSQTSATVVRDLAGDAKELSLALSEEMDVIRSASVRLLDKLVVQLDKTS